MAISTGKRRLQKREAAAGSIIKPTTIKRADGLETNHQIQHHQRQEYAMGQWAEPADGLQEKRVEGVQQQRIVDQVPWRSG